MPDRDWRASFVSTDPGDQTLFMSTFCVRETAPVGLGNLDADTVATDIASWLGSDYRACFPSGIRHERVDVRELGTNEPSAASVDVLIAGTLAAGTGTLPKATCPTIRVKTDVATRSARGRFHTPWPVYSSFLANGKAWTLGTGLWNALTALGTAMENGHDATHDVVVHHYSIRVYSRLRNTSYDAKSITPSQTPGYVRSRMTAP